MTLKVISMKIQFSLQLCVFGFFCFFLFHQWSVHYLPFGYYLVISDIKSSSYYYSTDWCFDFLVDQYFTISQLSSFELYLATNTSHMSTWMVCRRWLYRYNDDSSGLGFIWKAYFNLSCHFNYHLLSILLFNRRKFSTL